MTWSEHIQTSRIKVQATVTTDLWDRLRDFRLSPHAKLLYHFLLTNKYREVFGFYELPWNTLLTSIYYDHKNRDKVVLVKNAEHLASYNMSELRRNGLVEYDKQNGMVALPHWFRYNNPRYATDHAACRRVSGKLSPRHQVYSVALKLIGQTQCASSFCAAEFEKPAPRSSLNLVRKPQKKRVKTQTGAL